MIRKFLEWEKDLRENARAVDERRAASREEQEVEKIERAEARAAAKAAEKEEKERFKQVGGLRNNRWRKRRVDLHSELSEERRGEILSEKIKGAIALGFRVESRGDTWASLVNPAADPVGTGNTALAIGTLGLSMLAAPPKARRGRENDKSVYIEVKKNGVVEVSGNSWLLGGTYYDHVPRA